MIIRVFLHWNWKEKKVKQCSPTITWTSTKRTTHNSSDKSHPDRAWNRHVCFDIFCFVPFRYIRFAKLHSLPVFVYISLCFVPFRFGKFRYVSFRFVSVNFVIRFISFRSVSVISFRVSFRILQVPLSGNVTLCTQNVKYFCYLYHNNITLKHPIFLSLSWLFCTNP